MFARHLMNIWPGVKILALATLGIFVGGKPAVIFPRSRFGLRSHVFQIEDAPPPPSQGAVATDLDRLTYEPGEIIFRPGQSKGEYYVVIEGEVEIRSEGHGADQTVLRLGPGQFFGDQATLRGQQGQLTCHAVTRAVLLAVDRSALRDLLDAGAA